MKYLKHFNFKFCVLCCISTLVSSAALLFCDQPESDAKIQLITKAPVDECFITHLRVYKFAGNLQSNKGTGRSFALFRGKNFAGEKNLELLYGEKTLPIYTGLLGGWKDKPNNMSQIPKYGKSGFGINPPATELIGRTIQS